MTPAQITRQLTDSRNQLQTALSFDVEGQAIASIQRTLDSYIAKNTIPDAKQLSDLLASIDAVRNRLGSIEGAAARLAANNLLLAWNAVIDIQLPVIQSPIPEHPNGRDE